MTFVPEGGQLEQFLNICLKNHYQTSSSHVGVQWVNRESRRIWQNCTVHTGGALVNWLNCSSRCLPELQFSSSRCSARRPGRQALVQILSADVPGDDPTATTEHKAAPLDWPAIRQASSRTIKEQAHQSAVDSYYRLVLLYGLGVVAVALLCLKTYRHFSQSALIGSHMCEHHESAPSVG